MDISWYYTILVRRPYLVILFIAIFCSACIIVSLTLKKLPDFSDPSLGFEARGTEIGNRLIAWNNLLEETSYSRTLVSNPIDLRGYQDYNINNNINSSLLPKNQRRKFQRNQNRRKDRLRPKTNKKPKKDFTWKNQSHPTFRRNELSPSEWNGYGDKVRDYKIINETSQEKSSRNKTLIDKNTHNVQLQRKKETSRMLKQTNDELTRTATPDEYFCDVPAKEFSHFIIEHTSSDSLFNLNGLLALCQLEELIVSADSYGEFCQKDKEENCCRPWSLPNYVALLSNKSSCSHINQEDIDTVSDLLNVCNEYFVNTKLTYDCKENPYCAAPLECTRYNAVFNILHFLTDLNFMNSNGSNIYLKYAMTFVPVVHSTKILPLYYEWEKLKLRNAIVRVVAMDLGSGLENELFSDYLLTDSWLIALGGIFIMCCIWIYTASIFVTLMTGIALIFSIGLGYFTYTIIFQMPFFPYMNLLVFVIMIGIGADNVFLFIKIWEGVLADRLKNNESPVTNNMENLQYVMAFTLKHAAISMLISSFTTAGAFFASYTSSISSIKCFGIFAGTAVVANYLLMMTWVPATIAIVERFVAYNSCMNCKLLYASKLISKMSQSIAKFFISVENVLVSVIMSYSAIWIVLFLTIGVLSAFITLYWPGLQLPETPHFQLFVDNHPFEIYHGKLKQEFVFERIMNAYENFKLPLRFVWGVLPVDDGDSTNPYSYGDLKFDNNFNMSTKTAQVWLSKFCQELKQQPFHQLTLGLLLPNCFIENFMSFMNRQCIDGMDGTDSTPCCEISNFPYEPSVFELCLPKSIASLYATPKEFFLPGIAGPKFATTEISQKLESEILSPNITKTAIPITKALVVEFESNVSYLTSYHETKKFVQTVENWFNEQQKNAPEEMQGGWFTSELKFFALQDTLAEGTIIAILVAMGVSLSVLLLVTLNVLISLYAVLTVSFTIFTTVAVLILLGWKLNILESITVSTAIGLAVDYSLHYSVHYNMSPIQKRKAAALYALKRIIGPTAMAAFTTGLAGALMLFSNVLPYIQIGIFLVLVTSISWIYATFFLMSLLKVVGPQNGFMQFNFFKFIKNRRRQSSIPNATKFNDDEQSQIAAHEQLLAACGTTQVKTASSESHELDSLTSKNLEIGTISKVEFSKA